ncbi:unnamed protein product [marine sediment metagenome]|uniref:Uncharacterized protein n=1 Tax=marine sediment metagenome TaxID=412755 RepID=X1MGE7_9ZZZZ
MDTPSEKQIEKVLSEDGEQLLFNVSIENKEGMKRCTKCSQLKYKTEFSNDITKKDGLCPQCKECRSKYHKQWFKEGMLEKEEKKQLHGLKKEEEIEETLAHRNE